MNDISVKIVESSADLPGDVPLPPGREATAQNELDPLAIEKSEVIALETTIQPQKVLKDQKTEVVVAENCDENAKEKIESESEANVESGRLLEFKSEKIKEELLKDDTSSIDSTFDVNTNSVETNYEFGSPLDETEPDREDSVGVSATPPTDTFEDKVTEIPTQLEIKGTEELIINQTEDSVKDLAFTKEDLATKKEMKDLNAPTSQTVAEVKEIAVFADQITSFKTISTKIQTLNQVTALVTELNAPIKAITSPVENTIVAVTETAASVKEIKPPIKDIESVNDSTIDHVKDIEAIKPPVEIKVADVEMIEIPVVNKAEEKIELIADMAKPELRPSVNGDVLKEEQVLKRRSSEDAETESPLKKLCQEVEKTFPQHDSMINDYIQTATKNNVDEIQRHTEQLLSEIQTLRELAQKKEHEWNNILHLKKVKEEILLRLLRRKQVISFEKSAEINGSNPKDPFDYLNSSKNLAIDKSDEISGLALKPPKAITPQPTPMIQPQAMPVTTHFNPMAGLPPPYDKVAHVQGMQKPTHMFPQTLMMPGPTMPFPRDMNGQLNSFGLPMGRQGPTKDVKSIIADYRQRNPDVTPRRGRRMKSMLNANMLNAPRQIAPKVENLSNLGMLFNNLDMNQKAMLERLSQMQGASLPNGMSFKDILVQFANIQQQSANMMSNRPDMMSHRPEQHPPVRPEGRGTRRPERQSQHEDPHVHVKQNERQASSSSPRLPPPPPYPEISLLPVNSNQECQASQQNSLLHGILTKQACPAPQSYSPTLAKLLTSPERKQKAPTLPTFGQAKNCGEITITPVQPTPPPEPQPEKTEEVVQLDDEESPQSEGSTEDSPEGSGGGRLVIDEGTATAAEPEPDAPLCQGCRRRDAQFVCAGCANQWYCSRDCQVAAWDEHSEMCSG